MKEIEIPVAGMGCPHCVEKISKSVNELQGVNKVNIELERAKMAISFDEQQVNLEKIRQAVQTPGYDLDLRDFDPQAAPPKPTHGCP